MWPANLKTTWSIAKLQCCCLWPSDHINQLQSLFTFSNMIDPDLLLAYIYTYFVYLVYLAVYICHDIWDDHSAGFPAFSRCAICYPPKLLGESGTFRPLLHKLLPVPLMALFSWLNTVSFCFGFPSFELKIPNVSKKHHIFFLKKPNFVPGHSQIHTFCLDTAVFLGWRIFPCFDLKKPFHIYIYIFNCGNSNIFQDSIHKKANISGHIRIDIFSRRTIAFKTIISTLSPF